MLRCVRQCRVQKVSQQWEYGTRFECMRMQVESMFNSQDLIIFVLLHCWVCNKDDLWKGWVCGMDDLWTFAQLSLQQGWPLYFCTVEFAAWSTFVLLHSWVCSMDDLCTFAQLSLQFSNIQAGLHSWVWFLIFLSCWIAIYYNSHRFVSQNMWSIIINDDLHGRCMWINAHIEVKPAGVIQVQSDKLYPA